MCDPEDHFQIVWRADRLLKNNGYLVVHDFSPPIPFKNEYKHASSIFTHKLDFSLLFLAHPHYTLQEAHSSAHGGEEMGPDTIVMTSLIYKNIESAWPPNPWR
jgi:hypothetical protein